MIRKILVSLFCLGIISLPASAIAADVDVFGDICQRNNQQSSACEDKNLGGQNPIYGPDGFITKIVNIISIMVGIAAVISIILAGAKFVSSGNNPEEVTKAREYIQYALIALVVAALTQAMVRLILSRITVN